jgi:thioredoxin-related protein
MAGTELVMVEERGCIWCARWNAEIGPIYSETPEGAYAPLRRIDLRGERPEGLTFKSPLRITPTFVLVDEGTEVARLEGYPGEDFFWGLLSLMLTDNTDYEGGTQ